MKNDESYDRAMNDLMEAKEEIIRLDYDIALLRREKDYWQGQATRGGNVRRWFKALFIDIPMRPEEIEKAVRRGIISAGFKPHRRENLGEQPRAEKEKDELPGSS